MYSITNKLGKPEREIEKRRTKKEMKEVARPPEPKSATKDIEKMKKKRKIEVTENTKQPFKPCYTHFHFIVKRDPSQDVSQSSVYLQYCVEVYLVDSGILENFTEKVSLYTNGCFKHNKNYETQYWLASKMIKRIPISHHVLAPNEAHNQCDSSAAHAKIAIRKDIAQGAQFQSVSHLASSYSRCQNYYMFEVDSKDFPEPMKINHDEAFMMKCFDFYYEEKKERVLPDCVHKCKDKVKCTHHCCKKKKAQCVIVRGVDREGNENNYYLLDEEEAEKVKIVTTKKINELKEDFRVNTFSVVVPKRNPERERRAPSKFLT